MKTNFLKVLVVLFIGTLVLEGCRKGENDPLISLRSRDARITGEWNLVKYDSERVTVEKEGNETVTETRTNSYDGNIWTRTFPEPVGDQSYSYTRTLTIEKEGTYTYKETADGDQSQEKGRWSWLDDAKNKRRINLDNHGVFYIDQLKNSEMIFTEESLETETKDNGDKESVTFSMTAVYEKL